MWGGEGDEEGATIPRLHGDSGDGLHVLQVGDGTRGWDCDGDGECLTHARYPAKKKMEEGVGMGGVLKYDYTASRNPR